MRILYLADHRGRDNDDEGALAHALRALGHEVVCEPASPARNNVTSASVLRMGPDFLLTHKSEPAHIAHLPCKKVFWFFDLVDSADWDLQARSTARREWAERMTQVCDVGFLTDGDYVSRDTTGKLHHLMQGADERVTGPWGTHPGEDRPPQTPSAYDWTGDILFTGSVIHGGVRASFVDEMKRVWGNRFLAFGHHPRDRVHGRRLAELMACAKVVVCPDGPVTDRYWSNRIYQACGFGGLVFHPFCERLRDQGYVGASHLVYYAGREHLHDLLSKFLADGKITAINRYRIAKGGYEHTTESNLYRHRCAQLVGVVRDKLGAK